MQYIRKEVPMDAKGHVILPYPWYYDKETPEQYEERHMILDALYDFLRNGMVLKFNKDFNYNFLKTYAINAAAYEKSMHNPKELLIDILRANKIDFNKLNQTYCWPTKK